MTVTLRTSDKDYLRGVRTFYVTSLTFKRLYPNIPTREYIIKVIRTARRRTMTCTCMDAVNRAFPLGRSCKHIRLVREFVRRAHGVSRIPNGGAWTLPLEESSVSAVSGKTTHAGQRYRSVGVRPARGQGARGRRARGPGKDAV